MSAVAAPAGTSVTPPRVSGILVFLTLVFATFTTAFATLLALAGIDGLLGGSLAVGDGTGPRKIWPVPADSAWSLGLDILSCAAAILASAWVARILLGRRGETIPRWALVTASAAVMVLPTGRPTWVAAIAAALVLPRLPPAARPRRWSRRERLAGSAALAALFTMLVSGTLYAANQHPIIPQPRTSCGSWEGGGFAEPANPSAATGTPLRYSGRPGTRIAPVLCLENRAPTRTATILAVASEQVAPGPWHVRLAQSAGAGFAATGPLVLPPHATRDPIVEVRFTRCSAADAARTFTLASIPLTVRVDGALQVDSIALTNPIQTSCP